MSNHHPAGHHPQYGDRLLDDDTATKVYEAQGVVHQWIDTLRHELQQLPDHDTAVLQQCEDNLILMVGSVGTICGYLQAHTDLPLYALCYEFSHHVYALLDQWKAEYEHGGAAAVQHSGEQFFADFQHQFDTAFIGL